MPDLKTSFFCLAVLFCFPKCSPEKPVGKPAPDLDAHKQEITEQFMEANMQLMEKENDEMDYYGRSHNLAFVKTSSGIRYHVYKPAIKGDSIKEGMTVTLAYDLYLLNGTLCYSSEKEGKKTIVIAMENAESGLHKGLQYLKKGDKALLLIPSPLAHGLLGDFKKIPPQMPIVYDVRID